MLRNNRGVSMISAMISVVLVSITAFAVMEIIATYSKAQASIQKAAALENFVGEVSALFDQDVNLCDSDSGGVLTAIAPYSGTEEYPVLALRLRSTKTVRMAEADGPDVNSAEAQALEIDGWRIEDIRIKDFAISTATLSNTMQNANVVFTLRESRPNDHPNKSSTWQGPKRIRKVPIIVKRGGLGIEECYGHSAFSKLEKEKIELGVLMEEIRNQVARSEVDANLCGPAATGGFITTGVFDAVNLTAPIYVALTRRSDTNQVIQISDPTLENLPAGISSKILNWEITSLTITEISPVDTINVVGVGGFREANMYVKFVRKKEFEVTPLKFVEESYRIPMLVQITAGNITRCNGVGMPMLTKQVCEKMGFNYDPNESNGRFCDVRF